MDCCNLVSAVLLGVFESIVGNSPAGILCDQLDGLDNSIHNLMFNA